MGELIVVPQHGAHDRAAFALGGQNQESLIESESGAPLKRGSWRGEGRRGEGYPRRGGAQGPVPPSTA
eukprot:966100-Alexandrium_andersonii.AAC.1